MESILISFIQAVGIVGAAAVPVWLQMRPIKRNIAKIMHHMQVDDDRRSWENKLLEWRDYYLRDVSEVYRQAILIKTMSIVDIVTWTVDHSGGFSSLPALEKILNYYDSNYADAKVMIRDHTCTAFAEHYFSEHNDASFQAFRKDTVQLFKDLKNNKTMRYYELAQRYLEETCRNYIHAVETYCSGGAA